MSNEFDTGGDTMKMPEHYELVKMREIPKAQTVFWYEDPDSGRVFDMGEQEAAVMTKNRQLGSKRLIGVSDGSAMRKVMQNCGAKPGQMIPYTRAKEIMQEAYDAEIALARANGVTRRPRLYRGNAIEGAVIPDPTSRR